MDEEKQDLSHVKEFIEEILVVLGFSAYYEAQCNDHQLHEVRELVKKYFSGI
jgi:hypothetical protein